MSQVGIHKLERTSGTWRVWIDGYSIPFPDRKSAESYLNYIKAWANEGEVISYDPSKDILVWIQTPNVRSVSQKSSFRKYRRVKNPTQFDCKNATPKDFIL
ncbi:MAG: hypothetical protein EBU08_09625 [Micrococcales bacterium]|nr:hypothetical protein [Micrococcales bacterium]